MSSNFTTKNKAAESCQSEYLRGEQWPKCGASELRWKFSTTIINDRQLSRQKIGQKISVIKTNSFDLELLTFDDIKKIVHFGILIQVLS